MAQELAISFVAFTWLLVSSLFLGVQSKIQWKSVTAVLLLSPMLIQLQGVLSLNLGAYSFFVVVAGWLVLIYPNQFCQGVLWVLFLLIQASMTLFLFQMLISFDI
ncbi:MAG: hypothetical protein ACE5KK_02420, partial [Candidatus Brocadiales bacterium]